MVVNLGRSRRIGCAVLEVERSDACLNLVGRADARIAGAVWATTKLGTTSIYMRWLIVSTCLVLGACSSTVYDPPPVYAPELSKAIEGAKAAANEVKLVGPVEVSAARQAHPLGPGPYILCIRGTNSLTGTRTFAVFFKNDDYVTTRTPVIMDNCEVQPFTPLGIGPFPVAVMPQPQSSIGNFN